ncbi:MAG: glucose-1-phosphate cytidylyltransferase, partial [Caldilineaceae bacterium]|nr:glucose-1-phosphate cytidylyltransferase [Caldilineaceae bacterium]
MKVVLFCGGLGTRLKEYSETIPKPMVDIGYRPILWHLMKYYAHFGHTEFILCLGYRGDVIKNYFLHYSECLSNDFVLSEGGQKIHLLNTDISDWTITFVDTGLSANIGQRLMAVRPFLGDDPVFMANYADGLTDLYLPDYLDFFERQNKIASFLCVQPSQTFHVVRLGQDGLVNSVDPAQTADLWINGGFFILRQELFDYMEPGDELVLEPFQRLIEAQQLVAYRNPGFWACMDTFKET